jgi:hypothetical protein
MWLFALAIYLGCKCLTWFVHARSPLGWRDMAYLLGWPGMDAKSFLARQDRPTGELRPTANAWLFAIAKFSIGAVALLAAAHLVDRTSGWLSGWLGMIGIAMVLHFGLFDLLSLAWRSFGVDARPVMDWPLLADSVSEYWGRRWNTAFRDLAHRYVFRPVSARCGAHWALGLVYLVSGLVHDLVISLPAGAGYGGPTLFFAIQAGGALAERSRPGRRWGLGRGWSGWVFTMLLLLAPLPLLFHPPFFARIVLPMLRDLQELVS